MPHDPENEFTPRGCSRHNGRAVRRLAWHNEDSGIIIEFSDGSVYWYYIVTWERYVTEFANTVDPGCQLNHEAIGQINPFVQKLDRWPDFAIAIAEPPDYFVEIQQP